MPGSTHAPAAGANSTPAARKPSRTAAGRARRGAAVSARSTSPMTAFAGAFPPGAISAGAISSATRPSSRSFCRNNELKKFLRILEEGIALFGIETQGAGGQLCGDPALDQRGVRLDVAEFVHMNCGVVFERHFQLLGQERRLRRRTARRKRAHKAGKVRLPDAGRKMDAGDAGGGEKFGKTPFCRSRFKRHPIEKKLVAARCQQQAGFAALVQGSPKLPPRGFVLCLGARMAKIV